MHTTIDDTKIAFVICTNQQTYLEECIKYIHNLIVPQGYSIEIIPVEHATSMTQGYNLGMQKTNAKYKVYLHQDVFILNRNFLSDSLQILTNQTKIGMIGMVGTKRLPDNACMWTTPMRTGALRSCVLNTVDDYFDLPVSQTKGFAPVQAVDGLLIMTQYDIPWREDLNLGWDFYDISQSLEYTRQGYHIAVPYQSSPWVLHDNGFLHLEGYHTARKKFLTEYFPNRVEEIAACDDAAHLAAKQRKTLSEVSAYKQQILRQLSQIVSSDDPSHAPESSNDPSLAQHAPQTSNDPSLAQHTPQTSDDPSLAQRTPQTSDDLTDTKYTQITSQLRSHLDTYQLDEEYCILCLLANIDEAERAAGVTRHLFSYLQPDLSWITSFYRQIKFHIWQLKYPFPADIQYVAQKYLQEHLSDIAIQHFTRLSDPS